MPDPLVLLPGMNCSARLWSAVVPALESDGTAVIHADLDEDDLDRCVDALLTELPARFALAGLSLGGIVAMALVRRARGRVTRLCLASTNPSAPTDAQRSAWADQLEQLDRGRSARDLQEDLLPVLLHPGASRAAREATLTMADEVGTGRLRAQLRLQATRVDERPGLTYVEVPTLVLAAEDDLLCPLARHEEIHALVAHSRLVILPGTGHLSPLERPREVADALLEWWG